MTKESLLKKGFTESPHRVLGAVLTLTIGRNRTLMASSIGTPNEVIFITQKDHNSGQIDMVCIHNFDYDGPLSENKLDAIVSIFI